MKKILISLLLNLISGLGLAEPIKIIIPYPVGGFFDSFGRAIQKAGNDRGYDIVILNKPGADSVIGTLELINEKANNVVGFIPYVVYAQRAQESEELKRGILSLTPIGEFGTAPYVFFTNKDSKYKTWDDVLKAVKDSKNINIGANSQNALLILKDLIGETANINYLRYNGDKVLIGDVLNKSLDVGTSTYPGIIGLIKSDTVTGLAITTKHNLYISVSVTSKLPEAIQGIFMRPGVESDVKQKITAVFKELIASKDVQDFMRENGMVSPSMSIEESLRKNLK